MLTTLWSLGESEKLTVTSFFNWRSWNRSPRLAIVRKYPEFGLGTHKGVQVSEENVVEGAKGSRDMVK
jgi:hypothetical protein